jgi:phosphohistidine phosphatase
MKLFLVQHAQAVSGDVDPDRPLTADGRRDIKKITEFIKPLSLTVDSLLHSGKTRARQTAELLAEVVTVQNEMVAHKGLSPKDDVQLIKDGIVSVGRDLMIVGHLPFMAKLASLLLTGSESSETVSFKQGCIVCLSGENGNRWQIDWMITPEILA